MGQFSVENLAPNGSVLDETQHHDVVETLASDRSDQPFDMTVLPRRPRRDRPVANTHGS
jgi:hypothetical protein